MFYLKSVYVKIGLFLLSMFLFFVVYSSIVEPIKFDIEVNKRYTEIIKKMENIREAQIIYSKVTGNYCDNFDKLSDFIDTAKLVIQEVKDTSYIYYDELYRMDMRKEEKIVRVIGEEIVKDKFKNIDYRDFKYVNKDLGLEFKINSSVIEKNGIKAPVFEVSVLKEDVLAGLDRSLIYQEIVNFSKVRGESIKIGDMDKITTSGNWSDQKD